jgi:RimJ/RimL family protein N-acetyltransferase
MTESMSVDLLRPNDWQRYRAIRLRSLEINPEAFGGSFDAESQWSEVDWRTEMAKFVALVAVHDSADVAVMTVEVLDGDHGTTCWIGGCWSDPPVRGKGAFRALFTYVDAHAAEFGWRRQGLGVWRDNDAAIAAYKALGFDFAGEPMPSSRKPGLFYIHMIRDSIL